MNPTACTDCYDGEFLYETLDGEDYSGICINNCPIGFFEDKNLNKCLNCDTSCMFCNKP